MPMIALYILAGIFGIVLLYVLFLTICTYSVSKKKEYNSYNMFYNRVLKGLMFIVLSLSRVRIHVTGIEKIPKDQKLLFICNHRSNFDPMVTWYAFNHWKIGYISKASNFKLPFLGRMIRRICFMAIDRENPRNAIVTINKAAEILGNGIASIGVYPEGTRSKNCVLLPFHNGVFKIAQKSNSPIVVLTVVGTEKIHKRAPWRATDVYLDVLEILPAEEVKSTKTDIIGDKIRILFENNIEKRDV